MAHIFVIYRPEEKGIEKQLVVATELSMNVKTKNTFKYD